MSEHWQKRPPLAWWKYDAPGPKLQLPKTSFLTDAKEMLPDGLWNLSAIAAGVSVTAWVICTAVLVLDGFGSFLMAPIGIKNTPKTGVALIADSVYQPVCVALLISCALFWFLSRKTNRL